MSVFDRSQQRQATCPQHGPVLADLDWHRVADGVCVRTVRKTLTCPECNRYCTEDE